MNLLKASIASPSLWIITHIATRYSESIENLHVSFLISKLSLFCAG